MSIHLTKVLVLDSVDDECERILRRSGIEVTTLGKLTEEELTNEIQEYDGLVLRSATKVTNKVLSSCTRLKVVGRAGTGVDNIDVPAATRKGVLVMNTPGGNTMSAAEHTCALICSLSRSIPEACASLKDGKWNRKQLMGNELYGKVLAIIGLGRIGREVSKRMKAFGMTIIGFDPLVRPEIALSWGIESLTLEEIWPKADYITVHTPLIPQTRHLVGESALAACKDSVKIVNVARGGIVDEAALLKALNDGTCGGAALDVFQEEPPKDFSLVKHPKVICTPHLGANTYEAQKRVAIEIAEQLVDMSEGRTMTGLVNATSLGNAGSEFAQPWIQLASSIGSVAHHLTHNPDSPSIELKLDVYGSEINALIDLMGLAVQQGMMKEITKNGINLINAPILASEAGIKFTLRSNRDKSSPIPIAGTNSLKLTAISSKSTHTIIGSASSGQPALFAINDCTWPTGLTLDRNMLFFRSAPEALPLASIATSLQNSSLTSLLSSTKGSKEMWHVARTVAAVTPSPVVANTDLLAQLWF